MNRYVMINPVAKDAVAKNETYDHYAITLDAVDSLCNTDKRNTVHVYIAGKKQKADCESLENKILENYASIDSVKITNGKRYSGDEVASIFMAGLFGMGVVGAITVSEAISYAIDQDAHGTSVESYTLPPIWMYFYGGLLGMILATYYLSDLNGYILYMAKLDSASEESILEINN